MSGLLAAELREAEPLDWYRRRLSRSCGRSQVPAGVCLPPPGVLWVTKRVCEQQLQGGEIGLAEVGSGSRRVSREQTGR